MLFNARGCTYIAEKDLMVFAETYKFREHFNGL
jgi:hypothetical protein